jgi:predicted amidohydrolase
VKAAFIQTDPVFGAVEGNVESAVKKILKLDAHLVVLPELFNTGYQFRSKTEAYRLAEDARSGYTTGRLIEAARAAGTFIVAGLAERSGRRVYNSSVLVGPKGFISVYRKAHLFFDEKRIFSPGNTPFTVHSIGKARVGMMICFDWFFPEAARTLALKGADIICHPSNLILPHCPESMKVRSMENRVGAERRVKGKRLTFIGKSQVVSPEGEVIARAPQVGVYSKVVDIDPKKARDKRVTETNDIFRDRRSGLYFK